jgi:hypothetical protein
VLEVLKAVVVAAPRVAVGAVPQVVVKTQNVRVSKTLAVTLIVWAILRASPPWSIMFEPGVREV